MPAYLDLWSHTSPPPTNDPEVGLFLHGAERATAEVSLVWRGDLSTSDLNDGNGADRRAAPAKRPHVARVPQGRQRRADHTVSLARGHPEKGALLMAPHGLDGVAEQDVPAPVTEDETLSRTSQRPGQAVTLDDHTSEVVAHVECFTRTLGLREPVADDLSIAAFLHDAGKADARF